MKNHRVASVIDQPAWDEANWRNVAFLVDPTLHDPPGIGIMFGNYPAGCRVFNGWRERFGKVDRHGVLRVSIIRGRHPSKGDGYSVHFTTDVEGLSHEDAAEGRLPVEDFIVAPSRWRFFAVSSTNALDGFLQSYARWNTFCLVPLRNSKPETPDMNLLLGKTNLIVRDFAELEADDVDGLTLDD